MDNPVEAVDSWSRRLLLDALTGGWFHDPHDLDDAQYDVPPRGRRRHIEFRPTCGRCGQTCEPGSMRCDCGCRLVLR